MPADHTRPDVTTDDVDLPVLRQWAEILSRTRSFFDRRGFLEVLTPLLSRDTMVDQHIEPFRVTVFDDPRRPSEGPTWFLQSSPEFHMKRLLVAGAEAIYQISKAFRAGEVGRWHNIEFTMLEWYRVGDDLQAGMQLVSDYIDHMLGCGPARQRTYADAFQQYVGLNPHSASLSSLQQAVLDRCQVTTVPQHRDDLLNLLLAELIAPKLGEMTPEIVMGYPISQAALAEIGTLEQEQVALRFEIFVRGLEIANGYQELKDPGEMAHRLAQANCQRKLQDLAALPESNRLLTVMGDALPDSAGVALGLERLAALVLGHENIRKVAVFSFNVA